MSGRRTWIAPVLAAIVGAALAWGLWRFDTPTGPDPTEMAIRREPRRIVCMAPSITETLFALDRGDRVVGVSNYVTYPPEAKKRPNVGGLYDPNFERIINMRPDLIIVQQKHEKIEALCRQRQIPLRKVHMTRTETILGGIKKLGDMLGCRDRADALCAEIEQDLAQVKERVRGRPRPPVFLCLGRTAGSLKGLTSAGKTSFLSEMIEAAGGRNIFNDLAATYPQVSTEPLVVRAPEVIIETYPGEVLSERKRRQLIRDWQAMPTIPAVRNGRIIFITEEYMHVPGPRIARIAEVFAGVLHPGANDEE